MTLKHGRTLYQTAAWRRLRAAQLRAQPLCEWCKPRGRFEPATVVHHNERHNGDRQKFFAGPFTSLCKPCHDTTAQQREVIGYDARSIDPATGYPLDAQHPWISGKPGKPKRPEQKRDGRGRWGPRKT